MSKELVLTAYNGKQNREDCWYSRSNQYYLLGDYKKKNSGGAYRLKDGKISSKNYVIWSDYMGEYIRKRSAQKLIIDDKGTIDYVDNTFQPTQSVFDTTSRSFVPVLDNIDIEKFKFDIGTGHFYIGSKSIVREELPPARRKKNYEGYPDDSVYNYADMPTSIKNATKAGAKEEKPSVPYEQEMASGFANITFGVEGETSRCLLPQQYLTRYGFIPVRDGSIQGNELVSIPFEGVSGIRNVYHFFSKLQKYASVDHTCSLHVHQGNIKVKDRKKFIVALHWLYVLLQSELGELVPGYKTDIQVLKQNDRGRGKDYCKAIPRLSLKGKSIEERHNAILQWVNDFRKPTKEQVESRKHSKHGQNKWYRVGRYFSLNFDNWFFSNSNTIEYRLHHGTVQPERVVYWLAITMAITNYAINHADQILNEKIKYDLEDIINDTYESKFANVLNRYVEQRKNFFTDQKLRGDNGLTNTFKDEGIK